MNDKIFLIDTNILIYAYDNSNPTKREFCEKLLEECWLGKRKFALSVQNLSEFYNAITEKIVNPIDRGDAEKIIKRMINFPNFVIIRYDEKTVLDAIEISIKYEIHYWDSLLIATMRRNHIYGIYTENKNDFEKVKFLEVINPLE